MYVFLLDRDANRSQLAFLPPKSEVPECGCEKWALSFGAEICPLCGQRGEFDSWGRSVVEMMGRHQLRTGYPMSPHLARYRLPKLKDLCPDCGGSGLIDIGHGQDYRRCDGCNGDGAIPLFPPEVMRRYQRLARELLYLETILGSGHSCRCWPN